MNNLSIEEKLRVGSPNFKEIWNFYFFKNKFNSNRFGYLEYRNQFFK